MATETREAPAREAAFNVLKYYWVDGNNKATFPVDTVALATKMGAKVSVADLEGRQRGIAIRKEVGDQMEFLLNSAADEDGLRYACARLLALTHNHFGTHEPIGFIDNDDLRRRTPYMDEFAAELMMPGTAVRSWWGDGVSVKKMSKRFGVSVTQMLNRLVDLGLAG